MPVYTDSVFCNIKIIPKMVNLWKILGAAMVVAVAFVPSMAIDSVAQKLLAEGRVDDAVLFLRSRINAAPRDAESYSLLCRAYLIIEQWNPGIDACEKAVSLDPENGTYHLWLGRIYGEKADHSNFITGARLASRVRNEFETAVRLDPNSIDARADLADFYLQAPAIIGGGKDKAEAQAQEIAKVDPAQAHRVKARIAEEEKDYVRAESEYRVAVQLSEGKAGAWLNLARFYRRVGRLDEMRDAIHHATAPATNRPDLLLDAAQMLVDTGGNLPEASQFLRRYMSSSGMVQDAPLFKAHYLLGTILEREGDKQSAAEQYRAALSLVRNFSRAQDALNRLKLPAKNETN
jgi:tetratricopeptide (TPR) repeat protein